MGMSAPRSSRTTRGEDTPNLLAGKRSAGWGRLEGQPVKRAEAELLIDCEEDRTLRAVLVGMLREADRGR